MVAKFGSHHFHMYGLSGGLPPQALLAWMALPTAKSTPVSPTEALNPKVLPPTMRWTPLTADDQWGS